MADVSDDPLSPPIESPIELDTYVLSTAIYAERADGHILLLQRAEGTAMAGTFFLPGGIVDPGETPWDAAERELREESGLGFVGQPQMVGCYPIFVYGSDFLQLTFRGSVGGELATSHEHTNHRWMDPREWAAGFDPAGIESLSAGSPNIASMLRGIADDAARYLAIVG